MYSLKCSVRDLVRYGNVFVGFIVIQLLDLFTTSVFLEKGGYEMNPILLYVTSFFPLSFISSLIFLKLLVIMVISAICVHEIIYLDDWFIYLYYTILVSNVVFFFIFLNNVYVIFRLMGLI